MANDLDAGLMGLYRVVQDQPDALFDLIKLAEYSAETFEWSKRSEPGDDAVQQAFRFLFRNRFSRGGLGRDYAWSDRPRGGQPGDLNAWDTFKLHYTLVGQASGVSRKGQAAHRRRVNGHPGESSAGGQSRVDAAALAVQAGPADAVQERSEPQSDHKRR